MTTDLDKQLADLGATVAELMRIGSPFPYRSIFTFDLEYLPGEHPCGQCGRSLDSHERFADPDPDSPITWLACAREPMEDPRFVLAHWADHRFCIPCQLCGECHQTDHENYCPEDGER